MATRVDTGGGFERVLPARSAADAEGVCRETRSYETQWRALALSAFRTFWWAEKCGK